VNETMGSRIKMSRGVDGRVEMSDERIAEVTAVLRDVRGPIFVTQSVRDDAGERLKKLAAERAAKFQREAPGIDDYLAVANANPTLLRLSRGDVVVSDTAAEVS
jgi:hypothetical protein